VGIALAAALALGARAGTAAPAPSDGERGARTVAATAHEARDLVDRARASGGAARDIFNRRYNQLVSRLRDEIVTVDDNGLDRAATRLPSEPLTVPGGDDARTLDEIAAEATRCASERALAAETASATRAMKPPFSPQAALAIAFALLGIGLLTLMRLVREQVAERRLLDALLPAGDGTRTSPRAPRGCAAASIASPSATRAPLSTTCQLRKPLQNTRRAGAAPPRTDELMARLGETSDEVERLKVSSMLDELTAHSSIRTSSTAFGAARWPSRDWPPFCVLELDLDNFKDINDTFGHAAGTTRCGNSRRCYAVVREHDLVVRKSGDEFFVLAPDTVQSEAVALGERLRTAVNNCAVVSVTAVGDRFEFPLAASIGVLDPSTADLGALRGIATRTSRCAKSFRYVDAALYRAKHAERTASANTKPVCALSTSAAPTNRQTFRESTGLPGAATAISPPNSAGGSTRSSPRRRTCCFQSVALGVPRAEYAPPRSRLVARRLLARGPAIATLWKQQVRRLGRSASNRPRCSAARWP